MLFQNQSHKRIGLTVAVILATLTLMASLSAFWIMRHQMRTADSQDLQIDLASRLRLVEYEIKQQVTSTVALAKQPLIQKGLASIDGARSNQPDDGLKAALKLFVGAKDSALILYDSKGREVARAGWKAHPQFDVALALPNSVRLGWQDGYVLTTRVAVMQAGSKVGTLLAEKRLSEMLNAQAESARHSPASTLILCGLSELQSIRCFPSHKTAAAIKIVGNNEPLALAMHSALAGKSGYIAASAGKNFATAYQPATALGLGAMLVMQEPKPAPGLQQHERYIVLLTLLLLIAGGIALFWQVLPVIRKLQASDQHARELNQQLLRTETRIRAVLDQVEEGLVTIASDGLIRLFNPAAERIFGYRASEVLGKQFTILMSESDAGIYHQRLVRYLESGQKVLMGSSREVAGRRKNGDIFPVELRVGEIKLEDEHLFIGSMRDISDRKSIEQRMAHLANHDNLTNLPNRNLLQDRARQAVLQASRQDRRVGVIFLDLDHFKTINDLLGHPVGDRLLQTVAARILNCVRDEDTVARQGGDEFILVLPNIKRFEDVAIVAQKILVTLGAPYSIDGSELHVSASIGVSLYPDDGQDVETLMRHADTAMYYAKATGRNNFQFFTPKMNQAITERMSIEAKLRNALGRNEFALSYQPIVNLKTGQVSAAEALLRWQPDGGPISPDRFIPVAEETGLIVPIGEWVIRTALHERRHWIEQGLTLPRMVVNLSARQFAQKNLVATIGRMLQEVDLGPEHMGVEITESLIMERPEDAVRTLKALSEMGVQISIDDFGTGYSSLSYLKRFPLDKIKIDRSFISDIATDPDDAAIVTAIIAMAHSLNATVVAEGVETEAQLQFLRARGCDEFQGYYFSRPMSGTSVVEKMRGGMPLVVS